VLKVTFHLSTPGATREAIAVNYSRWASFGQDELFHIHVVGFVVETNPTPQLKMLVEYVAKVYAPMWFNTKSKPNQSLLAKTVPDMYMKQFILSKACPAK
jgi:hypothetical protein